MYAKIQKSGKGENKGSCSDYANYLDKENELKREHEKEYFFSHDKEKVPTFDELVPTSIGPVNFFHRLRTKQGKREDLNHKDRSFQNNGMSVRRRKA